MYSIKFVIAGLLFCGLLGRVELFKFGKYGGPPPPPPPPPPPQPEQERLYAPLWLAPQQPSLLPLPPVSYQPEPLYQAPEQQEQQGQGTKGGQRVEAERLGEASKGAPLPLAPLRQRPPALSYLIVRPVQSFGSYYEPQYQNYQAQFTRPAYLRDEDSSNLSTKGGQRAGQQREEQQQEQQQQFEEQQQTKEPIEQQEHIDEQQPQPQPPPPPPPPTIVYTNHPSKEYKLRALLERLKAKFTLGSSYQVVGEEYVQPIPPPRPLPARPPQPQQPVEQQQIQEQIPEQQQRELGFQEEPPKQQPIQEQQQQQQIEQHNQIRLEEEKGSKNVLIKQQEEDKGKRLAEKQTTQQQQQQLQESPLAQEPLRQNEPSKGQYNNNSGF